MLNLRSRRRRALLGWGLPLLAMVGAACSSATDPTTGGVVSSTTVEPSFGDLARQAGAPAESAPTTSSSTPELPEFTEAIHVLGSIQTIADPGVRLSDAVPVIDTDLATIASLACASSTCAPGELALWSKGQIQIMNVATRRAAIEGPANLESQVDALEGSGVVTIGFGADIANAIEPVLVGPAGAMIAVHAISLADGLQGEATETTAGIAGPTSVDLLSQSIVEQRAEGRGVVVLVDWGNVGGRVPGVQQLGDVELLIDAGADAIVGHGPNLLQRLDLVGQTSVAYNLGNASTDSSEPLHDDTAVLRLEFGTPGRSCLLPATASPSGPTLDHPELATCAMG